MNSPWDFMYLWPDPASGTCREKLPDLRMSVPRLALIPHLALEHGDVATRNPMGVLRQCERVRVGFCLIHRFVQVRRRAAAMVLRSGFVSASARRVRSVSPHPCMADTRESWQVGPTRQTMSSAGWIGNGQHANDTGAVIPITGDRVGRSSYMIPQVWTWPQQ